MMAWLAMRVKVEIPSSPHKPNKLEGEMKQPALTLLMAFSACSVVNSPRL